MSRLLLLDTSDDAPACRELTPDQDALVRDLLATIPELLPFAATDLAYQGDDGQTARFYMQVDQSIL